MNLFELILHINNSENAIQFLRDREILRSDPPICIDPQCMREMTEVSMGKRRRSGGMIRSDAVRVTKTRNCRFVMVNEIMGHFIF